MIIALSAHARATVLLALSALAIAACGDADSSSPEDSLTAYLPADSLAISRVDLDTVREQLGLADDADVFPVRAGEEGGYQPGDPEFNLTSITSEGFGPYALELQNFNPNLIVDSLDGTEISEVASNRAQPDKPVSVIKTSQSFDEIASALEDAGYSRDGDTVTADDERTGFDSGASSVTDAGGGVIVFAGGDVSSSEIVESPDGPAPLEGLIDGADEPIAVAAKGAKDGCVEQIGGWNDAQGTGTLRFQLDGPADTSSFKADALANGIVSASDPKADGDALEASYSESDEGAGFLASPVEYLVESLGYQALYECPGSEGAASGG